VSTDLRGMIIDVSYFIAAILFILGLKQLSSPATARAGNRLAAIAMTIAVAVTLLDRSLLSFWSIGAGMVLGAVIGVYFARTVKMTDMPQMVALFNGAGGATAALVALAEYLRYSGAGTQVHAGEAVSIVLGTLIGAVSFSGSIVAFAKLQGLLPDKPLRYSGQMAINTLLLIACAASGSAIAAGLAGTSALVAVFVIALALGVLAVLPIGGADMPVVISLLNSFTGVAAALTGFVVGNQILVVAGALVGASGMLLTLLMSKAMNRPLSNVLFGAFGGGGALAVGGPGAVAGQLVRESGADDVAVALAYARTVVIVPGYGLAVAQAQHTIRELADELEKRGVSVKYAIHPVAGRMPGHMNVLLAEANVPYDQLVEMEQINGEFESTDVTLVVGANDVVNPAARHDPSSPIFGMPILDVDRSRNVVVLKRSMSPGFAGIDNELFYRGNTRMLFGDARKSLSALVNAVKQVG
jgi:NAD(P) transhydrogenase subunit beta